MLVYAFGQGGATTAGLVAVAQLVPAALFAPYGGMIVDRRSPARVLVAGYLLQAAAMAAVAISLLGGGPPLLSYAFAAAAATAVTVTRPAQAVLVPALARQPDELTAFNVITGWIESVCILAAPALTGVVLGLSAPGTVFAICTGLSIAAAIAVIGLVDRTPPGARGRAPALRDTLAELAAGLSALHETRPVRALMLLMGAQYVVIGAFDVLAVVLAIDVLGLGDSGVGYLNAAYGAGAVVGALATVALIGRRRLAPPLLCGVALTGTSFVALGVFPTVLGAFVLLGLAGAGRIVLDVSGRTLLQRAAPSDFLSRTFGLLEALSMAGLALGSIAVPAAIAVGGTSAALIACGALLPILALLRLRALVSIDAAATVPIVELSLLRSLNIFAPLPAPVLEGLARSLVPERFAPAQVVMREGEPGHHFYAVADGEVEIAVRGRTLAVRRRCEGFGEIALLRESPRTATVIARTDALLYRLDKDPFLAAVTGHATATHAAQQLVRDRLATVTASD
jgi:predicted MFS family arabinose efflux permease